MTGFQTSRIGTDQYFSEITRNSIFSRSRIYGGKGFENTLKDMSGLASQMLGIMYEDVERNKSTIRFLERENVRRIEDFADNLLEIMRFSNVSPRRSPYCIMNIIRSNALSSRYSMSQIQRAADEVKRGRSSDIDKELLETARAYIASNDGKSNRGRNGKVLGSRDYVTDLAENVFGDFARSSGFQRSEKYGRMMESQIELTARRIRDDILHDLDSGPKQMSANQRRLVRDAVEELERQVSRRFGPEIEMMLAPYRIIGSGVYDKVNAAPNMGLVEALWKSLAFELEAGLGYGGSIKAGATFTSEVTASKNTFTFRHDGFEYSASIAGISASVELLNQLEAAINGELDWSGEFKFIPEATYRGATIGQTGSDIEFSIGFSAYYKVGGGMRIVFNVSEYRRLRWG